MKTPSSLFLTLLFVLFSFALLPQSSLAAADSGYYADRGYRPGGYDNPGYDDVPQGGGGYEGGGTRDGEGFIEGGYDTPPYTEKDYEPQGDRSRFKDYDRLCRNRNTRDYKFCREFDNRGPTPMN